MNHQEWAIRSSVTLVNGVKNFNGDKKYIKYKYLAENNRNYVKFMGVNR